MFSQQLLRLKGEEGPSWIVVTCSRRSGALPAEQYSHSIRAGRQVTFNGINRLVGSFILEALGRESQGLMPEKRTGREKRASERWMGNKMRIRQGNQKLRDGFF